MSPHGIKQSQINDGRRAVLNFFGWRVSSAHAVVNETFFDKVAVAVDNAAEAPCPSFVYENMFVRKNGAVLNDSEM